MKQAGFIKVSLTSGKQNLRIIQISVAAVVAATNAIIGNILSIISKVYIQISSEV